MGAFHDDTYIRRLVCLRTLTSVLDLPYVYLGGVYRSFRKLAFTDLRIARILSGGCRAAERRGRTRSERCIRRLLVREGQR